MTDMMGKSGTSKFHPSNHYYEDQFIILRELLRMNLKEDWDRNKTSFIFIF